MGGVILRTEDASGRAEWAARLGVSLQELTQLVFDSEPSHRASVGRGTPDEIWAGLADRFDLSPGQREDLERDFWRGDQVDRELVEYIRELRPRYKTGLLSNAWPDVREHITETWRFADAFDEIVISAEVGVVKPDARIYRLALERLEIPAAHAVFIDDFARNVRGAEDIGMFAIQFHSPEQVRSDLEALLEGGDAS